MMAQVISIKMQRVNIRCPTSLHARIFQLMYPKTNMLLVISIKVTPTNAGIGKRRPAIGGSKIMYGKFSSQT